MLFPGLEMEWENKKRKEKNWKSFEENWQSALAG